MSHQVRLIASSMCTAFSIVTLTLFVILGAADRVIAGPPTPTPPTCDCSCGNTCSNGAVAYDTNGGMYYGGTCPGDCKNPTGNCDAGCGCNPYRSSADDVIPATYACKCIAKNGTYN